MSRPESGMSDFIAFEGIFQESAGTAETPHLQNIVKPIEKRDSYTFFDILLWTRRTVEHYVTPGQATTS